MLQASSSKSMSFPNTQHNTATEKHTANMYWRDLEGIVFESYIVE